MVGVGVGFDTKGADSFVVEVLKHDRTNRNLYVIPDT